MIYDTIAAISTALGESAINVIRVSGDNSIQIVNSVFSGKNLEKVDSHTIHYGYIKTNETVIDEVMVTILKAPKTFTKENTVEISCHGGTFIASKILELILTKGARIAEPGEFTKRAFLNGRIDLTQAESVMDLIGSKTELSLKVANQGLDGRVSNLIKDLRSKVLTLIAQIEVNIDYPEYDDAIQITNGIIKPKAKSIINEVDNILESASTGKILREGIKTAIIGRPNVGKSSLLNALLREEKAIVTEIQGTTRDIVEGTINIGGIVLNLIDTAGIRETSDIIEKIGIDKAKKVISEAELVLVVLDNSANLSENDLKLLSLTENKKRIIIANKSDLKTKLDLKSINAIKVSALNNFGIEELEKQIKTTFLHDDINTKDLTYISNSRHIAKLIDTKKSINDALLAINDNLPIDMVEIDLKLAWNHLGEILGDTATDSLLDELFSKFCLGK